MLQITIPISPEGWDESKQEFVEPKCKTLQLEHSLVSISKWESKWKKAFLSKHEKTYEETIDYIKCMTLTQNVDPDVYNHLTEENMRQVNDYISDPMTASVVYEQESKGGSRDVVTSELIYYWMISLQIPVEFQKWHLNRLLSLIKVINAKNAPPKRRSPREIMQSNAAINAARRKKYNTKG